MRQLILVAVIALFAAAVPAAAQPEDDPLLVTRETPPRAEGEVMPTPQCFNIVNKAPYMVMGSIYTNFFTRGDGVKTRHKSNFRLEQDNAAEFCTYGPFYEGQKVELVIRTLVPVFRCKTAVTGDIVIYGRRKAEGGTDTFAACL